MTSSNDAEQRVLNLEIALAHLQHDLEQMSSVLLEQQRQIDSLRAMVQRLEHQASEQSESPEKRNLVDERPPHY